MTNPIRQAKITDLEALSSLFDEYRVFYEKQSDKPAAQFFLKERIIQQDSEIFVAENHQGQLMGFVQLYPIFSSTRMKKLWLLNDLYVNPKFRGQHISIALIDKAKELARNTKSAGLLLETAKTNVVGNNLYPRTGFELDSDHNYYSWEV